MDVGANVWAKTTSEGLWFRGNVTNIEEVRSKKKHAEPMTKFYLALQNDNGDPTGFSTEVITGRSEGVSDEYEFVKLRNAADDTTASIEDLTTLNHLHEPAILFCLHNRFHKNLIYTNTGPILIAVNPFKHLPIYDENFVRKYRDAGETARFKDEGRKLSPHVYQVADRAYRSMVETADRNIGGIVNQSILVSGESGAGKTVTTKFIMKYLADITRMTDHGVITKMEDGSIEQQVLQSNPILECFGNARTLRNDNSSRFGKFIEIKFASDRNISYRITGAVIRTYLLEKVRLVHQGRGERNFHCFYEVIKGGSKADRQRWGLTSLDDFHYTNQSGEDSRRDGVEDNEQYKETRTAMNVMKFTIDEQNSILNVVAAVLHLGNVKFDVKEGFGEDEDGSSVSPLSLKHMEHCCELLGFTQDDLERVLCEKVIKTKEKVYIKRQSVNEAEFARDALAKTIYGAMFEWIVKRVNATIAADAQKQQKIPTFIGVLDIFGFESFDNNSFEQLCINYTNEHLQHHFNEYVFDDEQKLYKREGISWSFIKFPDNNEILDLLENRRTGLFALCDEQVLFPRATDITLVHKFYEHCSAHPPFFAGGAEMGRNAFVVKHFAGPVTYSSSGFLEKNYDVVRPDMVKLMRGSTSWIGTQLVEFFRLDESSVDVVEPSPAKGARRASRTARIYTLSGEFRKQLTELMDNINTTSPHYIRCLKPNSQNVCDEFEHSLVIDQLRCNGVLEAVRVSRAGYPNRFTFEQFGRRYGGLLVPSISGPWKKEAVDVICQRLVKQALSSDSFTPAEDTAGQSDSMIRAGIQRGTSMVFLRKGTFDYLERARLVLQQKAAVKVQTAVRAFLARNWYYYEKRKADARLLLQKVARGFLTRLQVSKTMVGISHLSEKLKQRREEKKRQEFARIAKISVIARTWRRYMRNKKERALKEAAVKIQARIRAHMHRRLLPRMRMEVLKAAIAERDALAVQLAESRLKWEAERDAMLRANRARSTLSNEEVAALKAELKTKQKELEIAKAFLVKWKDRANSGLKTVDFGFQAPSSDPVCDEATLRKLISKEVIDQLARTAAEISKYKSKVETLEIQNRTLLSSEGRASAEDDRNAVNAFKLSSEGEMPPVSRDDPSASASYQRDIDDFDRNIAANGHGQSGSDGASRRRPPPAPPAPAAAAAPRYTSQATPFSGQELEEMLRPPHVPSGGDPSDEIHRRSAAAIADLQHQLDSAYQEIDRLDRKTAEYRQQKEEADGVVFELKQVIEQLNYRLSTQGAAAGGGGGGATAGYGGGGGGSGSDYLPSLVSDVVLDKIKDTDNYIASLQQRLNEIERNQSAGAGGSHVNQRPTSYGRTYEDRGGGGGSGGNSHSSSDHTMGPLGDAVLTLQRRIDDIIGGGGTGGGGGERAGNRRDDPVVETQKAHIESLRRQVDHERLNARNAGDTRKEDELAALKADLATLLRTLENNNYSSRGYGGGGGSIGVSSQQPSYRGGDWGDKERDILQSLVSFMFGGILLCLVVVALSMGS